MITSSANAKVKHVMNLTKKSRARREAGLFVAEGVRMFRELPTDRLDSVFVSESFLKNSENRRLVDSVSYETVADDVFKTMSDTATPQGILTLVRQFCHTPQDILNGPGAALILILDTIQDPGNLGTLLRAGEGAGVTGVVMTDTTADVYNPKVIRSTMGSICRVPFLYTGDLPGTIRMLKEKGIRIFAAHLTGGNNYEKEDYTVGTGFLIGNEANGIAKETAALADGCVYIPMSGRVESLNAAVAASVLMFEASRQRREKIGI